jgi:ABC-type branched-subunit amino acid transport system ATPase component/ABC-type branched-subunit amino acid transport system permease subunit
VFRRSSLARWALVLGLVLFPWVLPSNWANMGVAAAILTLALLSVVVLTGWVGQISLAQAALMGVGAFSAAQATNHLNVEFPFHAIIAGAAAALVALAIGFFALRIRGLYLAIATLGFQWAIEASFLQWHPFSGGFQGVGIDDLKIGGWNFADDRMMYYLAWTTAILLILMVANLRDSKVGRAWFAIRSSEVAAKTLGVNVMSYKLLAFATSGFIIGVAGSIRLNFVTTATPLDYSFQKSIIILAVAVLGGIGAIGGAVLGGIAYTFTDQYVFTQDWFGGFFQGKIDILAAVLLLVTVLQNPAGLIGMREELREKRAQRHARKERRTRQTIVIDRPGAPEAAGAMETQESQELVAAGAASDAGSRPISGAQDSTRSSEGVSRRLAEYTKARGARAQRVEAAPMLDVRDITISFGGVVANDGVSYEVRPGEICGLIGPNGAGKTTNFNAVNGLIMPNSGSVRFSGRDITNSAVHERAALGMGRTFQLMRLFPRLTVMENLMVGTHLQNGSGFGSNLLMLERTRKEDRRSREQVTEIMAMLGISEHAESKVAGLPFGVLRLVELGRALVTQPRLLLLDEPASGLDVSETDAFAEILFKVRDEMGHTIFIIEHDMRLVMMACDYLYVLEFGRNLAEGFPKDIQNNAAVIAAYLGEESVA